MVTLFFTVDMDAKSVIISGDAVRIGGRPVKDVIDSGIAESKKYSDKKLSDYANTVSKDLEKIQSQVDGQVEDWYFDYEPSMQNIPASQWTTTKKNVKNISEIDFFGNLKDMLIGLWKTMVFGDGHFYRTLISQKQCKLHRARKGYCRRKEKNFCYHSATTL